MKYVLIIAAVVILIRVDVILTLFDRASSKLSSTSGEISTDEVRSEKKLISFKDDQNLKQTPQSIFYSLLRDFASLPSRDLRLKILATLETNPIILSEKLDRELESIVYQWRDLLLAKNHETLSLVIEFQNRLKGENLLMIRRFTSLLLDHDLDSFLKVYVVSPDGLCAVVTHIGDDLPLEERINEFYDRERALNEFLLKPVTDIRVQTLAKNCQNALRLHMDKVVPVAPPVELEPVTPAPEGAP